MGGIKKVNYRAISTPKCKVSMFVYTAYMNKQF